jgi:hypothetical protein
MYRMDRIEYFYRKNSLFWMQMHTLSSFGGGGWVTVAQVQMSVIQYRK